MSGYVGTAHDWALHVDDAGAEGLEVAEVEMLDEMVVNVSRAGSEWWVEVLGVSSDQLSLEVSLDGGSSWVPAHVDDIDVMVARLPAVDGDLATVLIRPRHDGS